MIENQGAVGLWLLVPCLLACLALASGCAAEGAAPKEKIGEPRPTVWNRLWDEVTAKPGAEVDILRGSPVAQVVLADERAVYYFTKPPHPAHPAVVKRAVVERDRAAADATEGWTAGSNEAFQRWLETFAAQGEALIQGFREGDQRWAGQPTVVNCERQ